jgi:hypothetical protein
MRVNAIDLFGDLVCVLFCIVHYHLGSFLKTARGLLGPLVGFLSAIHHGSIHEMHGVLGSVRGLYDHGVRRAINFCDQALDRGGLFYGSESTRKTEK